MNHCRGHAILSVGALLAALGSPSAMADPIFWTDWTGTNTATTGFQGQGTITTNTTTITVTYTNANGIGFYQTSGGNDYWVGGSGATSPYTSAAVDNRPTGTDIVALSRAGTQTLNFSQAIANPVFAFASLNGNGYAFDQDFELLSLGGVDGNACGYWGCGGASKVVVDLGNGHFEYQLNSNGVGGSEPHGTLRFLGAFDTLTWRSSTNEYWNGFTVGVQGSADEVFPPVPGIPEPSTVILMGAGLGLLALAARRRSAR
ncbi:PEP-CTERM sorting domain-containing protein [Rhizobacter sp. Root404]|uniref:PEP-CTERM sorting domain-containing protein n=1 Tax=Rhizobacter sp. Root404 TaxID=1736528 RepID=UPI0007014894|nr:PEP-CTERM sorting domain-containing protein [Rhizobacter sp. Root404]KQW37632.1 PEP-CTERM domain protein [Rhizobacter sp. Root404]